MNTTIFDACMPVSSVAEDQFELVTLDLYRNIHKGIRAELSFGLGAVGAHRHRPVTPPVRVGIDSHEDAQLERTGAALADRALHDSIIGKYRPQIDGQSDGHDGQPAADRRPPQHP